jgi:hypothetical protein
MITFSDLVFEKDDEEQEVLHWMDPAEHAHHIFDNHYGVSVIRGPYTHGGKEGLYELAVLYMAPGDEYSQLVYDTPVTSDVEGHLTPDDVTRLMKQVSELPPRQ